MQKLTKKADISRKTVASICDEVEVWSGHDHANSGTSISQNDALSQDMLPEKIVSKPECAMCLDCVRRWCDLWETVGGTKNSFVLHDISL